MVFSMTVLAYLGPETMLPMTSVVAGVIGVLMMFGRNSYRWVLNAFRAVVGRNRAPVNGLRQPRKIGAGPVGGIVREESTRMEEVEN